MTSAPAVRDWNFLALVLKDCSVVALWEYDDHVVGGCELNESGLSD